MFEAGILDTAKGIKALINAVSASNNLLNQQRRYT
jgi:hypothetical protein